MKLRWIIERSFVKVRGEGSDAGSFPIEKLGYKLCGTFGIYYR